MQDTPAWSDAAQSFQYGRYRHFKGGEYRIVTVARDSEDRTKELVVYQSLSYPDRIWARPLDMFLESVSRDEYNGPRFTYLGPDEQSPAVSGGAADTTA